MLTTFAVAVSSERPISYSMTSRFGVPSVVPNSKTTTAWLLARVNVSLASTSASLSPCRKVSLRMSPSHQALDSLTTGPASSPSR
jgi:hypothetical protein